MPSYWNINIKKPAIIGDRIIAEKIQSETDQNIHIINLSKTFKETMALKELNMIIPNNNCTALLGQNGSGKTTLVYNIINRFQF